MSLTILKLNIHLGQIALVPSKYGMMLNKNNNFGYLSFISYIILNLAMPAALITFACATKAARLKLIALWKRILETL